MRPVLYKLFGIEIYSYGFMIAIGIIAAVLLLNKRAKKQGYNEDKIFNMTMIAVIGGILGGKLLYIITEMKYFLEDPLRVITKFGEGFVIYGAIAGGALAVILYSRKQRWEVLTLVDMIIPSVAIGQGFGRIGCFLAGCCYGAETSFPINVVFKDSYFAPNGVHLHPTQLYSSAFNFLLALLLLWYDKRKKKDGDTLALYLVVYSIGRFIIEFFRDDPRGAVGVLSTSQFIAIITFIMGIGIFFIHQRKRREGIV
ncbi:prolipoprotein diacylglyceryl transferase [Alloiococcus sp. CFN-8]|uniref:prolipoprotein diacylglyceryl transferase n=1 Tax=Alloiococcus sp. CFN-8 TaxID=3416081 RepID=UPI003CE787F7